MSTIDKETIIKVLWGEKDQAIRFTFIKQYINEGEEFVNLMTRAFDHWARIDKILTKSKKKADAIISTLIYTALHSHIVSFKLFISGLLVPSGNTQRYVLECLAMSLLLSRPSLGVSEKYLAEKYSTNKAVRDLIRNHKALKLNREALNTFEKAIKFYDNFSHPTLLSLNAVMIFGGKKGEVILGGAYDPDKDFAYKKELSWRIAIADILPNLIQGIERNFIMEKG